MPTTSGASPAGEQVVAARSASLIPPRRQRWLLSGALVLGGMVAVFSETVAPTITGEIFWPVNLSVTLAGLVFTAMLLRNSGGFYDLPWPKPFVILALVFVGCLTAGFLGGVGWPNSGDENSYMFLADLLRLGRLFVPLPPDPDLFKTFHILTRDGRLFSPYPPAWPAVLALFNFASAASLAAPAFTLAGGIALWRALRIACPRESVRPLLVLALLNPFTLFLGGSFFAQSMIFALVATIIWLQLADDTTPRWWRKLAIGALFGIVQLTRYEVLFVMGLAYVVDRLVARRWRALQDGLLVAAGFIPFAALLLLYNAAITGQALQLTATWALSPEDQLPALDAVGIAVFDVARTILWTDELFVYGGMPLVGLALIALLAKLRAHRLRFFDALGPCTLLFYSIQPFTGGHQYGPRYWFLALPFLSLTVGTGPTVTTGNGQQTISRTAAAALVFSAVAFAGLLVTDGRYIAARRAVYAVMPPQQPAIVLIPPRRIVLWPWELTQLRSFPGDFTRNGTGFDGPVLYGSSDVPNATDRACHLGRAVYQWQEPGALLRLPCP